MAEPTADFRMRAEAREFQELFGKTSQVAPALRNQLRRRLREGAETAAALSRNEVLKMPGTVSANPTNTDLRASLAKGVRVQIAANAKRSVGIMLVASGRSLDPDRRPLVRSWNKEGGFRHPVFGNRQRWLNQKGRQYFGTVIIQQRHHMRRLVLEAMREAEKSLN